MSKGGAMAKRDAKEERLERPIETREEYDRTVRIEAAQLAADAEAERDRLSAEVELLNGKVAELEATGRRNDKASVWAAFERRLVDNGIPADDAHRIAGAYLERADGKASKEEAVELADSFAAWMRDEWAKQGYYAPVVSSDSSIEIPAPSTGDWLRDSFYGFFD